MKQQDESLIARDVPDNTRKIEVVPYDPAWPRVFDEQKVRIRAVLGAAVLGLEHVGSTSVPGLAAKPAGYRLAVREPRWFEHRMFKVRDPEVNVHVFSMGCPELDRCRLFRDWLRVSPQDRIRYAEVKQVFGAARMGSCSGLRQCLAGCASILCCWSMRDHRGSPEAPP